MHIGTTSPVRVRGSPAAAYVVPVCVGCLALRAPQLERLHMAIPVTVAGLGTWERTFENSDFPKMTPVGFEPTQLALVELESNPLDHSGKVSLARLYMHAAPICKHRACGLYFQRAPSASQSRHANKTVSRSGLRGWTQVPLAQAAWVQIPQLSIFVACSPGAFAVVPRLALVRQCAPREARTPDLEVNSFTL